MYRRINYEGPRWKECRSLRTQKSSTVLVFSCLVQTFLCIQLKVCCGRVAADRARQETCHDALECELSAREQEEEDARGTI
jgi:hypothetical protein